MMIAEIEINAGHDRADPISERIAMLLPMVGSRSEGDLGQWHFLCICWKVQQRGDGPNGLPDDIFIGIHHEIWPGSTPLAPHGA
jgi:hypothetical protein